MQLNKIMYIDLADPPPKSYAPKKKRIDQLIVQCGTAKVVILLKLGEKISLLF